MYLRARTHTHTHTHTHTQKIGYVSLLPHTRTQSCAKRRTEILSFLYSRQQIKQVMCNTNKLSPKPSLTNQISIFLSLDLNVESTPCLPRLLCLVRVKGASVLELHKHRSTSISPSGYLQPTTSLPKVNVYTPPPKNPEHPFGTRPPSRNERNDHLHFARSTPRW